MSDLEKFATASLRGPKRGIYQQLLAGLLVKTNSTNDPLIKISSICQASHMLKQKGKLDMNLIEAVDAVCRSFINTEINKSNIVKVSWSFLENEENWKKYISPWQKIQLSYFPFATPLRRQKHPIRRRWGNYNWRDLNDREECIEEVTKEIHKLVDMAPPHKRFFQETAALSKHSFFALKGEFERWALSSLGEVQTIIANEIDPRIYKEVLWLAMGKELQKEESEEAGDTLGAGK